MADTYISFYLRNNRIHIFVDALRGIGSPKYVCFLIADDKKHPNSVPVPKEGFLLALCATRCLPRKMQLGISKYAPLPNPNS